jgi:UDP-GlcNAc:undecaprenyl-phosphate/decaprenyl-phosphate GlcNAc-1-phosphate transferase
MLTALTSAVALVMSLAVTPVVRLVAQQRGLLDQPDAERKIHEFPVPRLGGVAIAIAFAVAIGFAALATDDLDAVGLLRPNRAPAILAGAGLLVIVGVIDDVRGMRAMVKLIWQVAAAVLAYALGLSIQHLEMPWGTVTLGVLALPLTVAWIVIIINAINLIDGLDGLATGVVLTALGAFALLSASAGVDPTLPIIAAAGGAAIGFLAYNLYPASIIMGDTGSMFLGFVVGAVAISLTQDGLNPQPPIVPMVALAIPLADTVWAVIRRTARGEPFFVADRGHIHHQLLRAGLNQRDAMLILTAVSAALALIAVLLGDVS